MLAEPCCLVPQLFERASLVALEPPMAEEELDYDEACTHHEARGMSAMSEEAESPIVENQAAEDRLREIVRQTHLAVRSDLDKPVFRRCFIVGECYSGHDHQHHAEVFPHVEHYVKAV